MKIFSQDLMTAIKESQRDPANYVRFEVYAYYLDAQQNEQTDGITVTITAPGYTQGAGNYIDVPLGTPVTYTVTKTDYETEGPTTVTVTGPAVKRVQITNLPMWTFTIVPTPADSTVSMASGSRTSNTGTISVPQGSTVTYSISHTGMDSYSSSRLIPASPQDVNPITIARTLNSTIYMESIDPADATISWNTGVGDPTSGLSCTAPCTSGVVLTITKSGYNTITRNFPSQAGYLTTTNLGAITMTKKALTCTLACNTPAALISMWKEENGVEVPNSRVTGNSQVTINCVVDDDIHWSVEKQYYITQTGHWVMTGEDKVLPPVTLLIDDYVVTITSDPAEALVTIYNGSSQLAQGWGGASASVPAGTYVTYTAVLGGVTESGNATITANYTDQLTLSATDGQTVNLVTTSGTATLQYGKYRFVLVGGGAGGQQGSQARSYTRAASGGSGGGGGGSGYAIIQEVMISNKNGQQVTMVVGPGGAANTNGSDTQITVDSTTYVANGGKSGFVAGADFEQSATNGGDGGSGGGSGGIASACSTGNPYIAAKNGGNGAYAGNNGATVSSYNQLASKMIYHNGGTGFYDIAGTYENNAGALKTSVENGNPGGGGRGLVAIQADLLDTEYFLSLSNLQVLYNNLGGGGGGGPTGLPSINSSIPTVYGGPGGGGGSWTAGATGLAGGAAGTGGSGAILYMRVAWS